MLDWIKSWFGNDGKIVIHIDSVVFPLVECDCKPCPITAPVGVTLHLGDSFMSIKFPVSVPAGAPDVVKTVVSFQVEGADVSTIEIAGNGGDTEIVVPEASNGEVWASYADAAGNVSPDSPHATWTNASDTTPPAAPAGAPTLGEGDTV